MPGNLTVGTRTVGKHTGAAVGATRLGSSLSLLLIAAYFGFIALGAFAPGLLARPLVPGGATTLAFAYRLFVIALGVLLTDVYVVAANRRADGAGRR